MEPTDFFLWVFLWFCGVSLLLCDRHRPSCVVHPYRVGVPVVGRTVFRLPINVRTFSLLGEKGEAGAISRPLGALPTQCMLSKAALLAAGRT